MTRRFVFRFVMFSTLVLFSMRYSSRKIENLHLDRVQCGAINQSNCHFNDIGNVKSPFPKSFELHDKTTNGSFYAYKLSYCPCPVCPFLNRLCGSTFAHWHTSREISYEANL